MINTNHFDNTLAGEDDDIRTQMNIIRAALTSQEFRRFLFEHPKLIGTRGRFCDSGKAILEGLAEYNHQIGEKAFERQLTLLLHVLGRLLPSS